MRKTFIEPQRNPLPPPGGYLEEATTFYTTVILEKIMFRISSILSDMEIDFTVEHEHFLFKCEIYPLGRRLKFWIRIYSHESKYAVEMQRRTVEARKLFKSN